MQRLLVLLGSVPTAIFAIVRAHGSTATPKTNVGYVTNLAWFIPLPPNG